MSPIRMSRIESASRIVLAFNEAFNSRDIAGMMKLISDNCVLENYEPAPDGSKYSGREEITKFWQDYFQNTTQVHIDIEEILGFGMRCMMRWKCTLTDSEGKKQYLRGVSIFKVYND